MKKLQKSVMHHVLSNKELVPRTTTWISNSYIPAATSDNTRKAYRSDIHHFEQWGGLLPATHESIVRYLESYAPLLNPRTLARRLTALKHWHTYQQLSDPTAHPVISKTMAGISRTHGRPKDKAPALTPDELSRIAARLQDKMNLAAVRDNALLQIGYFGALRRSELVALCVKDIKWENEGITVLIPQSKTDQTHEGQSCAIPLGEGLLCPIQALKTWLELSGIHQGPIFRRIYINNNIAERALTALSVNHILQQRASDAGIAHAADLSSHSLRRGLATSAARAGAPLQTIMRHGRWKQVNTVMEYIQASESFTENAAKSIFLSRQEAEKK